MPSFLLCVSQTRTIFILNIDILQRVTDAYSDTGSVRQLREVPDVLEKTDCLLVQLKHYSVCCPPYI